MPSFTAAKASLLDQLLATATPYSGMDIESLVR